MTERIKAWQCIGCGRIEATATCLGICQDVPITVVSAADYDALRGFLTQLVRTRPRDGEWERTYRAMQERARRLLAEEKPVTLAA
jgi:hypothetical protein